MSSDSSGNIRGQAEAPAEELSAETREVVAYYDALAPTYDADRFGNTYGAYLDGLERRALRKWLRGPRVLDLACGTGRFLDLASEGLDLSGKMVERARERWPDKRIHHAPAWSIPAADGSYDSVFALHLFMHLHLGDIRRVLNECRRVLRRGGVLVFDFPNALRRRLVGYRATRLARGHRADDVGPADIGRGALAPHRLEGPRAGAHPPPAASGAPGLHGRGGGARPHAAEVPRLVPAGEA